MAGSSFRGIAMDSKIAELTEKIYREGVEKGTHKADEIIKEAQARADKLLGDAREEASRIVAEATKKANDLRVTTEVELKHSSQQAINALKQRIIDLISARALSEPITKTLADPALLRDLITTVVKNFGSQGAQAPRIELLLPAEHRAELEKAFKNGVLSTIASGVDLTFSKEFKSGFQVKPAGGSYKISLTDEDFSEYFKEYLRPRAKAFLFGE